MAYEFDNLVRRDFSGCEILWFSANPSADPGSFLDEAPELPSLGSFMSSGTWLRGRYGSDVIAASWQKSVEGMASGILVIQLKQNSAWGKKIQPGDGLLVFMSSTSGGSALKTTFVSLVFVDRVEPGRVVDGRGATVVTVSVSARDAGKIFEETATVSDPSFTLHDVSFFTKAQVERFRHKIGLSPPEMVLNILDILYSPGRSKYVDMQWRFPGAEVVPIVSLVDVSTFVQTPIFGFCPAQIVDYVGAGNVWALMKAYSNDVVNELFVDVRDLDDQSLAHTHYQEDLAFGFMNDDADAFDAINWKLEVSNRLFLLGKGVLSSRVTGGQATSSQSSNKSTIALVMRQKPYDTISFRNLPTFTLDETEIVAQNTGRAYHNVYNFFRFSSPPILPQQLQEFQFGIMVNPKSIMRFGLRRCEIESQYIFASKRLTQALDQGSMQTISFSAAYEYYVNLLATWNAFNERLDEGTITCRFRPDIRVGTRLIVVRHLASGQNEETEYYVSALKHSFMYEEGSSNTVLQVTRGVNYADNGPEATLYWTDQGRYLKREQPYEVLRESGFEKPENQPGSVTPDVPQTLPDAAQTSSFRFIPPGTKFE